MYTRTHVYARESLNIHAYFSVVQQLGLPDCAINPSGARYISEVLCNKHITCNIQKLNLSDNINVSESITDNREAAIKQIIFDII